MTLNHLQRLIQQPLTLKLQTKPLKKEKEIKETHRQRWSRIGLSCLLFLKVGLAQLFISIRKNMRTFSVHKRLLLEIAVNILLQTKIKIGNSKFFWPLLIKTSLLQRLSEMIRVSSLTGVYLFQLVLLQRDLALAKTFKIL